MPIPGEIADEFDLLMRRAGLVVPEARRAAVLAGYADFREQMALLRDRYNHTNEPANVFRLNPGRHV